MIKGGSQYIANGKTHYENNRQAYIDKNKKRREGLKSFVWDYKSVHPCVDCGNSDPRVLDFDHVRGEKSGSLNRAVQMGWSLKRILEEIDKCEVRCANCHRIVTHERRVASVNG